MKSEIVRVYVDCRCNEKVADVYYSSGYSRMFVGKFPNSVIDFCKAHIARDIRFQIWLYE